MLPLHGQNTAAVYKNTGQEVPRIKSHEEISLLNSHFICVAEFFRRRSLLIN